MGHRHNGSRQVLELGTIAVAAEDLAGRKGGVVLLSSHYAWTEHVREHVVSLGDTLADVAEIDGLVEFLLSEEPQLIGHRELLNALQAIALDDLANGFLEQKAGSRETTRAVSVVELQQLVESRRRDLKSIRARSCLLC